ncbi:hypothetical protein HanRHA438_Chr07g0309301 [Helianthus annuus]|nr:hypothetical protein HanRHA438_Chr07g0309301 [Helianthus annuus]
MLVFAKAVQETLLAQTFSHSSRDMDLLNHEFCESGNFRLENLVKLCPFSGVRYILLLHPFDQSATDHSSGSFGSNPSKHEHGGALLMLQMP